MEVKEASAHYLLRQDQDCPLGYKKTEVGVIPEDWNQTSILNIAVKVGSGVTPKGGSRRYKDDGRPFVRSQNVGWGKLLLDDLVYIDEETHEEFSATEILANDVLLNITGASIGRSVVANESLVGGNVNQHVCIVRTKPDKAVPGFVNMFLLSSAGQRQIDSFQAGGNREGLNFGQIRSIKLPLPPTKAEQEAIARALSDMDALIESLEQLIANKRHIKQGAMQELLTGKRRLPGFSGEWKEQQLGELGRFLKGSGVKKDEALSGNIPCVRYGEIYMRHNDYIRSFYSWISPKVAVTATPIRYGDILFAGSGETKEDIGKCVAFVNELEAYAGGDIVILRSTNADPLFLGYYLNTLAINRQKASKGQGDAIVHISGVALAGIRGSFPPITEQSAIASVLSDMDTEITALETKLTKLRQLKQGMMHELLTGRIRLVKPANKQQTGNRTSHSHNWAFNEAVVISVLADCFGDRNFPLGRKRYTKLSYLLHRKAEQKTEGYLKKAAGPYNPKTKYAGPEKIALQNGYIQSHKEGKFSGFIAAENVDQAHAYFAKWYGQEAVQWLEQFRFRKNDELELLATVDMAMEDLRKDGVEPSLDRVKGLIASEPEWLPKLSRDVFSDEKITVAIETLGELFGPAPENPS